MRKKEQARQVHAEKAIDLEAFHDIVPQSKD